MEPQTCTKCGTLPQDILMLSCGHDLCLNCAAQRLSLESKKKTATGISCQFCNQKTQLDTESIYELQRIMVQLQSVNDILFRKKTKKILKILIRNQILIHEKWINIKELPFLPNFRRESKIMDQKLRHHLMQIINFLLLNKQKIIQQLLIVVSIKKIVVSIQINNCYIIALIVIVNVFALSVLSTVNIKITNQPIIKGRLDNFLQNIDNNVQGLLMKKNEYQKHIKEVTEQNNICKKQIQKSFGELKAKINNKQKQILGKCDKALQITIQQYEKGIKAISRRVDEVKQSSQLIVETLKKQELILLNFYARKNGDIQQIIKKIDLDGFVNSDADKILINSNIIQFINQISAEIVKVDIDSTIKYDPKYDDKPVVNLKNIRDDNEQSQYGKGKQKYLREEQRNREYTRKY